MEMTLHFMHAHGRHRARKTGEPWLKILPFGHNYKLWSCRIIFPGRSCVLCAAVVILLTSLIWTTRSLRMSDRRTSLVDGKLEAHVLRLLDRSKTLPSLALPQKEAAPQRARGTTDSPGRANRRDSKSLGETHAQVLLGDTTQEARAAADDDSPAQQQQQHKKKPALLVSSRSQQEAIDSPRAKSQKPHVPARRFLVDVEDM